MKTVLFVFSLFLVFLACNKPESKDPCCILPGLTEMVRPQTQCADEWGYGTNNDQTINKLAAYLTKKQITGCVITMQSTGETVTCKACTCSSGYAFHVWADSRDINALVAEGFVAK